MLTIGGSIIWTIYVYFGTLQALAIGTLVILIIITLALIGIILYLLHLQSSMVDSQIRILRLMLVYYQTQQITTCQKEAAVGEEEY